MFIFHICKAIPYNIDMKKIMFCGGGSCGHVMPNVALIQDIKGKYRVGYIGTDGPERAICENENILFYRFDGVKLHRGKIIKNLSLPIRLYKSVKQCKKLLQNERPDVLFCKGGYASLPPALAAKSLKIPVITHESDFSLGLANKIISLFAVKTLCAFHETAQKTKRGKFVGTPIRSCVFAGDKLQAKQKYFGNLRPCILVFGGGGGSKIINENLNAVLAELCIEFNVLHVCGKGNASGRSMQGYRQMEFCNDMGEAYACADYAVARCGANAAAELLALKIPTLFIPLQNAQTRGDQVANANYYAKKGWCHVLKESQLTPDGLLRAIKTLYHDDKIKTTLAQIPCERGNEFIMQELERIVLK